MPVIQSRDLAGLGPKQGKSPDALVMVSHGTGWPRRYHQLISEYEVQLELWRYAAQNSCMKLHISDPFFTSDRFFWKLARILLVAVPPLIGFCALAWLFISP